jgi:hypothetical protein
MINTNDSVLRISFASSIRYLFVVVLAAAPAMACARAPQVALERLIEARRLAADLVLQFTTAADAANRAVMATTDEDSAAFAAEAEQATQAIQRDQDALAAVLRDPGYSEEHRLLEEFGGRFAAYRSLDRSILDLAVENTNLKAQRLSFGPAQKAVDEFSEALDALARAGAAKDRERIGGLTAAAVAAVRDIQVQQAPHIAESDEAVMLRLEKRMTAAEAAARRSLATLADTVPPAARTQLTMATAALDRFAGLNTQIVALSHRNTNVRSLALTLGQKRALTAACEEILRALQDALGKRGFAATR